MTDGTEVQFPTLQKNEQQTWYDATGKIVFTINTAISGVGVDRSTYNVMDYMKPMYTGVRDKENLPVPVSIIFDEEAYLNISNIRFNDILPSFQNYTATPYIYDIANSVMLMMISASDKASGARKKALIDTSMAFATWLESMPPDVWDRRISTLNRLQIIKRTRRINEEEQKELYQITARSSDSYPIMVGASILLERFKDAEYWLSYMDSNEQNEFRKFPIFHLWKNES